MISPTHLYGVLFDLISNTGLWETNLVSETLAASASGDKMSTLMAFTHTISAIWRNACTLGIFDHNLWAALDFSWEVILSMRNMVATHANLDDLMHFMLCEQTQMSIVQTAAKLSM
jgi:hypothetical protein